MWIEWKKGVILNLNYVEAVIKCDRAINAYTKDGSEYDKEFENEKVAQEFYEMLKEKLSVDEDCSECESNPNDDCCNGACRSNFVYIRRYL